MAGQMVRVEYHVPLPVPVRDLPALNTEVARDMEARGIPADAARMSQVGHDLVLSYEFPTEGPATP